MKMKKYLFDGSRIAVALALVLVFASGAWALTLSLSDGVTTTTVQDGMIGDINPMNSAVTYMGSVGNFQLNVTTGVSKGGNSLAILDLNSIDMSGGAGTLTITLYDTFTLSNLSNMDPNATAKMLIGGTTDGNVSFAAKIGTDLSNLKLVNSMDGFTGAFSDTALSGVNIGDLFILEEIITITHFKSGDLTSLDAGVQVAPVPEPGTLLLLGGGLVGIFSFGRKRMRS